MQGPRVTGPTREIRRGKERWRVVLRDRTPGSREAFSAATQEEAELLKERLTANLEEAPQERTVEKAITDYLSWLVADKGNKATSVASTGWALRRFLNDGDRLLTSISARWCEKRYEELKQELAVDSHRNLLSQVKTFFAWCLEKPRRWVSGSPVAEIKGSGRRNPGGKGKVQPTLDEAQLWLDVAYRLADDGDDGAVAALMTLLMGLRATEIVTRTARDVDGGGTLLRLDLRDEEVKTEGSAKPVLVPAALQPYLIERKRDKLPGAFLFPAAPRGTRGRHDRDWPREQVHRICKLASIPQVHAHGMRGMRGTLEVIANLQGGSGIEAAQRALRHDSKTTTSQSYAADSAVAEVKQAKVLEMLGRGGK